MALHVRPAAALREIALPEAEFLDRLADAVLGYITSGPGAWVGDAKDDGSPDEDEGRRLVAVCILDRE